MEIKIIPLSISVPIFASCAPSRDKYRVHVESKWLSEKSFDTELTEFSLKSLDNKWQEFCAEIETAFEKNAVIQ
jgi:hypothetical protein